MCGGARAPAGNTRGSRLCCWSSPLRPCPPLGGATEHDDGASPDRPTTPTARGPSAPGRADDARAIHAGTLAPRPRGLRFRWRYAKCAVDPPPRRTYSLGQRKLKRLSDSLEVAVKFYALRWFRRRAPMSETSSRTTAGKGIRTRVWRHSGVTVARRVPSLRFRFALQCASPWRCLFCTIRLCQVAVHSSRSAVSAYLYERDYRARRNERD